MKQSICTAAGFIGGAAAWAFGGWDTALAALTICMGVDYVFFICLFSFCFRQHRGTGIPQKYKD